MRLKERKLVYPPYGFTLLLPNLGQDFGENSVQVDVKGNEVAACHCWCLKS